MEKERYIVITTIFPPSEAVVRYAALEGYRTVIVGDRKSPADWFCSGSVYLSLEAQKKMFPAFDAVLPIDHYARKMMGYLYASREGAERIIDTDDDNIPKEDWAFPPTEGGDIEFLGGPSGFFNIYSLFSDALVWPRGLPLSHILLSQEQETRPRYRGNPRVGIWQGLADDNPDVDAIYRLTNGAPIRFKEASPVVLSPGIITPLNTQNTLTVKALFPLLYLPVTVSFRFTDILRGLVAQPILWLYGYHVGVLPATVIQKRNPHDSFADFISEIPMYTHAPRVVEVVAGVVKKEVSLKENLRNAYRALAREGIVQKEEIKPLDAWLDAV